MSQLLLHSFNFSYIRLFIGNAPGMEKLSLRDLRDDPFFKLLLLLHLLHSFLSRTAQCIEYIISLPLSNTHTYFFCVYTFQSTEIPPTCACIRHVVK